MNTPIINIDITKISTFIIKDNKPADWLGSVEFPDKEEGWERSSVPHDSNKSISLRKKGSMKFKKAYNLRIKMEDFKKTMCMIQGGAYKC